MTIIQEMENEMDPTYTTPDESSLLYQTHRSNSAIMRMAITNSIPTALAATADLELDAPPGHIAQTIHEYFANATTTAHLLLKQEAENTIMTHDTTLEEYIARHREIRTRMRMANYLNTRSGESVTVQFMIQGLSTHTTYKHLQDIRLETGTVPESIKALAQRLKAVHARTMERQATTQHAPHAMPQPQPKPYPTPAHPR